MLDNSWRKENYKKMKNLFKLIIGDRVYYNLIAYKALKISPYYIKYKALSQQMVDFDEK